MNHQMPQKLPWNEDETLILLDALLQVLSGTLSRKDAVDFVSQKLRAYAIHHGTAIDAVFRNQNGIRLQMSIMECAYTNGERGLKQHEVPKLFQNVVSLYKNDRGTYETRLAAAKDRIDSANPVQTYLKERKNENCPQTVRIPSDNRDASVPEAKPSSQFSAELLSHAEAILSSNFTNGMRKNAAIAQKKFRKAYLDLTGRELPESVDMDVLASAAGVAYDGKFYAVSERDRQEIRKLISTAVDNGNRVIFYEEFYRRHLDFMTRASIFSSDMLSAVLRQILPNMWYNRTFFAPTDDDTLEQDIVNCFGDASMRTYDEIKVRLVYADLSQIRQVCSYSNKFVWVKDETYALTDRIQLSQADIGQSLDTISQDIERQGFSVFRRISVSESTEWNPDMPEAAIQEALYLKHLAPLYAKNRSIITPLGVSLTAPMIMMEHCKGLRETTLSELQAYEEELTDKSTCSLYAACETMIRVDRDHFVSLDAIDFNIRAIDDALSLYVQGKVIPLASVKSFTSFPEVDGHPWNLFLLDSFCRHKSLQFHTMGGPAKSRPVGAIFPVQMRFDSYNDLLARAAAESGLALCGDIIAEFLTQNAYTLRRIEISRIISKAQEIRLQEDIADV